MSLQPSYLLAYQDHYLKEWLSFSTLLPQRFIRAPPQTKHQDKAREGTTVKEADMASAEQNSPLMVNQWRNREMEPPRNRAGGTVTLQPSAYSVFNLTNIRNKEWYLMGV